MKKGADGAFFVAKFDEVRYNESSQRNGAHMTPMPQTFPEVKQFFPKTHAMISRMFPKDDASRLMDVFAYRHHNKRFEVFHVVETQLENCSAIELQALVQQIDLWKHNILEAPEYSDSFNGSLHQEILHHFIISTICQDL